MEFRKVARKDIRGERKRAAAWLFAAEEAKIDLSTRTHTHVGVPVSTINDEWPYDFVTDLSRTKLEQLVRPVLKRCAHTPTKAMRRRGIGPDNIDHLILIGSPNQMPVLRSCFESVFRRTAEPISSAESVAIGAALRSARPSARLAASKISKSAENEGAYP